MRKVSGWIGALCTLFLLATSFSMAASAAGYDTKKTEAIKGTPTIDGKMDDIWKKANKIDVNQLNKDLIPSDSTTTAEAYTMWDDTNFYFLAIVKDSHVSDKGGTTGPEDVDSIEIQIDEKNSKGKGNVATGNAAAGCFRVDANGKTTGFGAKFDKDSAKFKGAAVKTDTGYIVEAAVPFSAIKPAEGTTIAMEVQINDNMADKGRAGLIAWNSNKVLGWQDTEAMGEVKLVAAAGGNAGTDNPKTGEAMPVAGAALLTLSAAVTGGCIVSARKKK